MKKHLTWLIGLLACSSAHAGTFNTIRAALADMKGKPFSHAVERLGLPTSKFDMEGVPVYSWDTVTPGGSDIGDLRCTIKLAVGPDSNVTNASFDGNQGACDFFAGRLKRTAPH